MSETETWTGKLIPIDLEGKTFDEWIKVQLGTTELNDMYETWAEYYDEEQYMNPEKYKHVVYSRDLNQLFEVVKKKLDPYGFSQGTRNDDGSYDFLTSFYNGGTYLNEVLQEIIAKS